MKFKKILSSPLVYVIAAYVAGVLAFWAQAAVARGSLVPGTIESTALLIVLTLTMVIGPILGFSLAVWHLVHKVRFTESLIGLLVSLPLLLIVMGVVVGTLRARLG